MFNPATTEYKKIPEIPHDDGDHVTRGSVCGFGYDHVNDDFKLLALSGCNNWIYSLRSRKWRRVVEYFGADIQCTGLFLNDPIHWVVSHDSSELPRVAGFNLSNSRNILGMGSARDDTSWY